MSVYRLEHAESIRFIVCRFGQYCENNNAKAYCMKDVGCRFLHDNKIFSSQVVRFADDRLSVFTYFALW